MKSYNCFLYHPKLKGWEQYELLQKNIETADPKTEAQEIYKSLMDKEPKGVHSLEIPVTINGANYSSIHCAYNGGGLSDEIVLAERIEQ